LGARAGSDEPRALAGNLDGLVQVRGRNDHVAAHQLFDLDEGSVRRGLRPGNLAGAELASEVDELVAELFAPLVELCIHPLHLGRRWAVCFWTVNRQASLQTQELGHVVS